MVLYVITQVEEKFICLICQNVFDAQCDQISFCFLAQQHSCKEPKKKQSYLQRFLCRIRIFLCKSFIVQNWPMFFCWLVMSNQSFMVKSVNTHSLEISRFFYHSDFAWNQFWGFLKCKINHFNTFRGLEFWFWWIFCTF